MKPFAAKLKSGQEFLGLGLSDQDLFQLRTGEAVVLDLSSIDVGLWFKDADGKRTFVQPRESRIVLIPGDTVDDIGGFLNVRLPASG